MRKSRWLLLVASAAISAAIGYGVSGLYPSTSPKARFQGRPVATHGSLDAFLSLARRGLQGTYQLTYDFSAHPRTKARAVGTLVVAARARAGSTAWTNATGEWSYRFKGTNGQVFQWIERQEVAEDCMRWSRQPKLVCTGPTTYVPSNGFIDATQAFVPGATVAALREMAALPPRLRPSMRWYTSAGSKLTGPLSCLRVVARNGLSVCLTRGGLVASLGPLWPVGFFFGSIRLAKIKTTPSSAAFEPYQRPVHHFVLPPN